MTSARTTFYLECPSTPEAGCVHCYYCYFFISSCLPFWDLLDGQIWTFLGMSSATIFSLVGMGTFFEWCFVLIRMSLGCFGVTLDSRFVLTSTAMETYSSVLVQMNTAPKNKAWLGGMVRADLEHSTPNNRLGQA